MGRPAERNEVFERIIKIPGKKSFSELSVEEVALMIEADSALESERSEYFSSCALDEFLHSSDLSGRPDLERIRDHIAENIYISVPGKKDKKINVAFLKRCAENLRASGNHAP